MKHLKTLALAAVATSALFAIAGAGSASATVLCSTTADPCPSAQKWGLVTLEFSIPSGSAINLKDTSGNELDKCTTSKTKGPITNTGSSTATVTSTVEETTWGGCTFQTNTVVKSKLEIHKIAGTSNGTVTSDGEFQWTINTVLFGSCIFGYASGTDIGTITEGKPATFHLNAVVKRFGTNFACPETERMTGTYTLTSPSGTTLSVSSS
jgi:hypothetical protein